MKISHILGAAVLPLVLVACAPKDAEKAVEAVTETVTNTVTEGADTLKEVVTESVQAPSLDEILAAQPETVQARYEARHPKETLEYFGIKPGMTVAEVLPGGGWYTKILTSYLGQDGRVVGIDYDIDMWRKFGGFAGEEFLKKRASWTDSWVETTQEWRTPGDADITAVTFGSDLSGLEGQVDVLLMVRALHHLNRFDRAHWDAFLNDAKTLLAEDGIIAVVQHRGPEGNDDTWANGDNGYLKQSFVIAEMDKAGFEVVGEPSEINANPKDVPSNEDIVWRLPPTLGTSRDNPELRAKMESIGESDRMTLKFRRKAS